MSDLRLQCMRLAQLDSDKPHVALSATTAARDADVNLMLTMLEALTHYNIKIESTPPYDPRAGGRHESVVGVLWSHCMAAMLNAPHRIELQ